MGEQLLDQVVEATGLPQDMIFNELGQLIEAAGLQKNEITLDELRSVLAEYVQDILLKAKEENDANASK